MAKEVTTALLEHQPQFEVASLKGHRRYAIKGQVFPAIIAGNDDDEVKGVVYRNLSPDDMEVFDDFEDVEYFRTTVTVITEAGEPVQAFVYIWKDAGRALLYGSWDYENFRQKHLQKYLYNCQRSSGHPLEYELSDAVQQKQ